MHRDSAVVIGEKLGSCEMDFVMTQDVITVTQCDVCDKTLCTVSTVSRALRLFYNAVTISLCICTVFNNCIDAT